VITISGLIPDLGGEAEVKKDKKKDIIVQFSYDNTLEEIDGAMKSFQMKFSGKRWKIMIAAYALLTAAALTFGIFFATNPVSWLALAVCGYGLVYTVTDKKRMRNKTINALKNMPPEDYTATVYADKIEIETVIKSEDNATESDEDPDTENIAPLKSTFLFGQDLLDFEENSESLLLIAARRQIYCFPKRCLDKEQQDKLRNILETKLDTAF